MTRDRLLATVAAVALAAGVQVSYSLPTLAQDQSAQSGGLEEIIVTARKRAENLMEVPLSISAFTAESIEKIGIDNFTDLANQTPGLSFRQADGRVGSGQGGSSLCPIAARSRGAVRATRPDSAAGEGAESGFGSSHAPRSCRGAGSADV